MRRNCQNRRGAVHWAGPWGVAATLLVLGGVAAGAEEARPGGAVVEPLPAPTVLLSLAPVHSTESAGEAGMRAYIDPATGQLREPTAEEVAALGRRGLRASALSTKPVVQHADGMLSVELGEEYMTEVVVRRNADGSLAMACVPRPLTDAVLKTPAPPRSPELEKE